MQPQPAGPHPCSGRRKARGLGLPGCGSGVTLPISTNPNPRASIGSITSPSLSKPAATPAGRQRQSREPDPDGSVVRVRRMWGGQTAATCQHQRHASHAMCALNPHQPSQACQLRAPIHQCSSHPPRGFGNSRPHTVVRREGGSGRVSRGNRPRRAAVIPTLCDISMSSRRIRGPAEVG